MSSYDNHMEYKNVIFGRTNTNVMSEDGTRLVSQTPHYILFPNILRWTESRMLACGRALWEHAGRDMEKWDAAPEAERRRFARMSMGRYSYVEIFEEGDEFWYRSDSSVGGNYPLSSLKIVEGL